jgi:tetratricopeptide (TPR) repeat protein
VQLENYRGENGEKGALEDFNKALELDPEKIEAIYGRGFVKAKLGDQRAAMEDFTKAIEFGNNENAKILYTAKLGKIQLDEIRNGLVDRTKMSDMSAGRAEVFFHRGLAKAKSGDPKSAIEDYNRAISFLPTYADAYFQRGIAKSSLGDQRNAIQDCNNAIELNSKFAEAYFIRGIIKLALNDTSGCLDLSKAGELGYAGAYNVIRDYCN